MSTAVEQAYAEVQRVTRARAKNFAYAPAPAADLAGPLPLIPLDVTGELDRDL